MPNTTVSMPGNHLHGDQSLEGVAHRNLSKRLSDIHNADVRNIKLDQSLFPRMLGVGSVGISSSGQSGVEIAVAGIPDPGQVRSRLKQDR